MSTNYYFINKDSRVETEKFNDKLAEAFDTFAEQLKVLGVEDTLNIELEKWMYEKQVEKIHIGKRSYGWKPLFEANYDHFDSMKKMKDWYSKNQNNYTIENEYEKELTWNELEEELISWQGEKTHIGLSGHYSGYYNDEDGYEWTRGEFS